MVGPMKSHHAFLPCASPPPLIVTPPIVIFCCTPLVWLVCCIARMIVMLPLIMPLPLPPVHLRLLFVTALGVVCRRTRRRIHLVQCLLPGIVQAWVAQTLLNVTF